MAFRTIVGHRRVTALLARSIARRGLPQSLIFGGPDGVGKRATALAVAEALNCVAPVAGGAFEVDACGTCAACRRIARRIHPDVLILEPNQLGNIAVDVVRDAIDQAAYRPYEGGRRVVIVDRADALMVAAQNALLKTLEEPPAGSVFILVTSRPDSLLPTVRSRCSKLRFGRLSTAEVIEVLTAGCGIESGEARNLAALADGSPAQALDARAGDGAEARATAREILEQLVRARDARARLEPARDLVPARGSSSSGENREQLAAHLRAMASMLRDVAVLVCGADPQALANADLEPALKALARSFDGPRVIRAFTAVDDALGALERNASPKVVADWVVLQV